MRKIFIVCAVSAFLCSCSGDFINLSPETSITEGNFYKTEKHFDLAINNAYSSLRGLYGGAGYTMSEMRSDNTHYTKFTAGRGQQTIDKENVADFVVEIQNQYVRDMWKNCYSGVAKSNTILGRIGGADLSDEFKNSIIGQAKFLRAFFYFQLVQYYGGVPLQLEEVRGTDNIFLPRASVEEVYKTIVSDVTDAIEKLPIVAFPQNGAATKGAAKMLYAYVLMTKSDRNYTEAEKQLNDVMKMGYQLEAEYARVFDTTNKNGVESIFSVQYQMGEQGQHSNWLYEFMPRTNEGQAITGVPASNTIDESGWNVPTPAMIAMYKEGDKRLDVSVAIAVGSPDDAAMKIDGALKVGDPKISTYSMALPFVNKYRHPHSKIKNTDDNWPVYRYADALLLLAECLVEQGRATEAAGYVNQVRVRAGLEPIKGEITAKIVADERKVELAYENHRWFDLLRTGQAIPVMTEYGKYIKTVDKGLAERTYQLKNEFLLYPIPYREMEINKNLKQNPGY